MKGQSGLTRTEACVAAIVVALFLIVGLLPRCYFYSMDKARGAARQIRCRLHLAELAKGMAVYLNDYGDSRWYPCPLGRGLKAGDYNGGEWLASLYWTRVIAEPDTFNCPTSPDWNENGRKLGTDRAVAGLFDSMAVSYAGLHYYSLSDKGGAIPASFPSEPAATPMACDDTEGSVNHDDTGERSEGEPTFPLWRYQPYRWRGMNVLFFDGHVQWKSDKEIDVEHGVGRKPGLLWRLRN